MFRFNSNRNHSEVEGLRRKKELALTSPFSLTLPCRLLVQQSRRASKQLHSNASTAKRLPTSPKLTRLPHLAVATADAPSHWWRVVRSRASTKCWTRQSTSATASTAVVATPRRPFRDGGRDPGSHSFGSRGRNPMASGFARPKKASGVTRSRRVSDDRDPTSGARCAPTLGAAHATAASFDGGRCGRAELALRMRVASILRRRAKPILRLATSSVAFCSATTLEPHEVRMTAPARAKASSTYALYARRSRDWSSARLRRQTIRPSSTSAAVAFVPRRSSVRRSATFAHFSIESTE